MKYYYVTSTNSFGNVDVAAFTTKEKAIKYLNTEQADFREREIVSRERAIELVGWEEIEYNVETCADIV